MLNRPGGASARARPQAALHGPLPWLLASAALVYVIHEQLDAVRLLALVIAAALLAVAGVWRQRALLRAHGPARRTLLAAAAASALLAALWVALGPVGHGAYAIGQTLVPVPLGWGMVLCIDGFPGNVIVARDLGGANARLIERFPRHVPLLAAGPIGSQPAGLVPLPTGAAAPSR